MRSTVVPKFLRWLTAAILLMTASTPAFAQQAQTGLPTEPLTIRSGDTMHEFVAEIAATDSQRAKGLMFRKQMSATTGMLFIFESEGERYFWMKNTPLPLDIIYIASDGTIVSIAADTTPFSESVIPSGAPAKYALELNAGTAVRLGIKAGDIVSSPAMDGK